MMTNNSENNEAKQNKNRKRLLITVASAVCVLVIAAVLMTQVIMPNNKYNEAVNLLESGEYLQAIDLFTELGDHKDSKTKIRECEYQMAISMMENGHYEEAISAFQNLKGYKDSLDKISECEITPQYNNAIELMETGDYSGAIAIFEAINETRNCQEEIIQCRKLQLASIAIGDSFYLGMYEQDGNNATAPEPIEWIVIGVRNNVLYAISKYALDCNHFPYEEYWEKNKLRSWLNTTFRDNAFSEIELAMLKEDDYGDLVSVLNNNLVWDYCNHSIWDLPKRITICRPTAYAISQGVVGSDYSGEYCYWLVRYSERSELTLVNYDGLKPFYNNDRIIDIAGIRPVILIDLE